MKVLIINGSPRVDGNSSILIQNMTDVFNELNVEVEVVRIGDKDVRGCVGCLYCKSHGSCVFNDIVNEINKLNMEINFNNCELISNQEEDIIPINNSKETIKAKTNAKYLVK